MLALVGRAFVHGVADVHAVVEQLVQDPYR